MAGTLLPFGFLTPILFAAAAARVSKRAWYGWAALYAAVAYGGLVATLIGDEGTDLDGAGSLAMVIAWTAGCAHGVRRALRVCAALPGIDDALASDIVAAREQIDGFGSLEDLGGVLGLDGNTVEDLRPYVVFLPR